MKVIVHWMIITAKRCTVFKINKWRENRRGKRLKALGYTYDVESLNWVKEKKW